MAQSDARRLSLQLPDNLPNSVTLQPGPSDVGKVGGGGEPDALPASALS